MTPSEDERRFLKWLLVQSGVNAHVMRYEARCRYVNCTKIPDDVEEAKRIFEAQTCTLCGMVFCSDHAKLHGESNCC